MCVCIESYEVDGWKVTPEGIAKVGVCLCFDMVGCCQGSFSHVQYIEPWRYAK